MAATGLKKHGLTAATPQNLLFSAGVYYKNLKWQTSAWQGTILGATSGGGTLSITPEYTDAELDGATVKIKGATFKTGETATMEINLTEIVEGTVAEGLHLEKDTSGTAVTGYTKYKTKEQISEDDYLENIAFVGTLTDGRQVIVIMENAICTGAFELEGKNKTQATFALTYECTADIAQESLNHLPVYIYFPTAPEV